MNEQVQTLIDQSMKNLKEAIDQEEDGYNKMQLQKVLDEFHSTVNNLN